jgi:hypothetical protein
VIRVREALVRWSSAATRLNRHSKQKPRNSWLRSRGYAVSALAGVGAAGVPRRLSKLKRAADALVPSTFSLCQRDVACGSQSPDDFGAIEVSRVWPLDSLSECGDHGKPALLIPERPQDEPPRFFERCKAEEISEASEAKRKPRPPNGTRSPGAPPVAGASLMSTAFA